MGLPYEKGVSFGFIEKIILDSSIQTPLKMCLKKLKVCLLAVQCFFFDHSNPLQFCYKF